VRRVAQCDDGELVSNVPVLFPYEPSFFFARNNVRAVRRSLQEGHWLG